MTDLVLSIQQHRDPSSVGPIVRVQVAVGHGPLTTFWMHQFVGVETDYLDTLSEAATGAYLYGERPRDVAKACERVRKAARRHRLAWEAKRQA